MACHPTAAQLQELVDANAFTLMFAKDEHAIYFVANEDEISKMGDDDDLATEYKKSMLCCEGLTLGRKAVYGWMKDEKDAYLDILCCGNLASLMSESYWSILEQRTIDIELLKIEVMDFRGSATTIFRSDDLIEEASYGSDDDGEAP